ncbi:MAG: hypothetical protein KatS3mg035_0603 [Bacteroidia bacterium]|nr:MAG: hypothetical protein KatS3mg035_0603 [Bacteroidia bacterium]
MVLGLFFSRRGYLFTLFIKLLRPFIIVLKNPFFLATLVAFHPYLLIIARSTTFVHLGTVLLLYTFYVYWKLPESHKKYLYTGFLCGLCLLTHGTFQILPVCLSIFLLLKKKFFYAFEILLLTFLTVFPWTIRNYITFQKPIFLVTGMGMQYWKGEESAFREKIDIYKKVYEEKYGQAASNCLFLHNRP